MHAGLIPGHWPDVHLVNVASADVAQACCMRHASLCQPAGQGITKAGPLVSTCRVSDCTRDSRPCSQHPGCMQYDPAQLKNLAGTAVCGAGAWAKLQRG